MRQLVAIFFSDMVGYSRQVDQDEAGALARLAVHNRIMQEAIRRYEGTVIKTVGDAFVATFPSGVAAAEAALDAQRSIELHNSISGEAEQIQVRIGVHAGDVLLRDADLFGEAVNLAAGLEPIAPAGGVAISRTIYDQIRRKVRAQIVDLGQVSLKNIFEPVQVYVLTPGPEPVEMAMATRRSMPSMSVAAPPRRSRRSMMIVAGGAAAAAIAAPFVVKTLRNGMFHSRPGGKLRYALGDELGSFKLFTGGRSRSRFALRLILEKLVDAGRDGEGVPGPLLSWKTAGNALEVEMRPDLWFHDHPCFPGGKGRRVQGADVAFSLRTALLYGKVPLPVEGEAAPAAGGQAFAGIRTSEAGGLSVALTGPAPFIEAALQDVPLLPRELLDLGEKILDLPQPPGTGPFRVAHPTESSRIQLLRAPRHWRPGLPLLDEVEMVDGADVAVTLGAMSSGEIDIYQPSPRNWATIFDLTGPRPRLAASWNTLDVEVASLSNLNNIPFFGLLLSPRTETLRDPLLRQAVAWAIDRSTLLEVPPHSASSGRFLLPSLLGFDPLLPEIGYDPARAQALLEKAGHPNGQGVPEILIACPPSNFRVDLIVEQLKAVGLKARVVRVAAQDLTGQLAQGSFDTGVVFIDFATRESEAPDLFYDLCNDGGTTPRLKAITASLTAAPGRPERVEVYRRAEKIYLEELPAIPIGHRTNAQFSYLFLVRRNIRGFHDPASGVARLENLRQTWREG